MRKPIAAMRGTPTIKNKLCGTGVWNSARRLELNTKTSRNPTVDPHTVPSKLRVSAWNETALDLNSFEAPTDQSVE
jgi:hypothetical protein